MSYFVLISQASAKKKKKKMKKREENNPHKFKHICRVQKRFGATDESPFETGAENDCERLSSVFLSLPMLHDFDALCLEGSGRVAERDQQ